MKINKILKMMNKMTTKKEMNKIITSKKSKILALKKID